MSDSPQPVGSFTVTPEELCPQYDESSSFTRSPSGLFWVRPSGICHPDPRFVLWIQAAQHFLMDPLLGQAPGVAANVQTFYRSAFDGEPMVSIFQVSVWPIGAPEAELENLEHRYAEIAVTGRLHLPCLPDSLNEISMPMIEACDGIEASRLATLLIQASKKVKFAFPQMYTRMASGLADRSKSR
ncbi:hypothetical protein [Vreelandella zhaodongensis]|uniref:hypothetical protein n=1 Tax=Vreelandella zhaodongensis TaxID=1176240 RepID=UPI003EB74132